MSYDLYLKARTGTINENDVLNYFRNRPHYTVEQRQASYENKDTGVYFMFEMHDGEPNTPEAAYPVAFNLNFFRPSYFISEAEPEVTAFVRQFDCVAFDPQTHGMGEGEYQNDKLVSGWNHGNEFAYRAVLDKPENRANLLTLPADRLIKFWQWNYDARMLQERQTRDTFVPHIFLMKIDGQVATMSVWPDAISSILPEVDYLLIRRQEFAPRRLLRKVEDEIFLPWKEALPILERHGSPHPGDAISLKYVKQPKDVADFVSSLTPRKQQVVIVPASEVLDRELVEKATRGR